MTPSIATSVRLRQAHAPIPGFRRGVAAATADLLLPVDAPVVATASGAALPGLTAPAAVALDADGIAHIQAADEHDRLFLQGWVHAGDRLLPMNVSRRRASGALAEPLGADAIPDDVAARAIGLRQVAERSLPVQSPKVMAGLDAYAAGVNAWIATHDLSAQ